MDFSFDDILSYLASAYRRGVLVPFIGSGMSVGACTSWQAFLEKLAVEAGLAGAGGKKVETSELYRLADQAAHGLRILNAEARAHAYRRALLSEEKSAGACAIPPQTQALARRHWPLVLSTNYDDLYVASRLKQSSGGDTTTPEAPEILGRSVEDCHKVVRSLDTPTRPILWALQGYLGGQAATPDTFVPDKERRQELESQVVAGHQQYQNVINSQAHFRRAFAEVFHRRSLLFLGSGILEDYLVNLFGEIAHHYGPSPHPHFALFPQWVRETLDARFLQTRLGILPVYFKDYGELPRLLEHLANCLSGTGHPPHANAPPSPVAWMPDELGFTLSNGSRPPFRRTRKLRLRYVELPVPAEGGSECVVVSLGRRENNHPREGSQARALLGAAGLSSAEDGSSWRALDEAPSLVYRFGDKPIFGIAARRKDSPAAPPTKGPDHRDLNLISQAVCLALSEVSKAGFRTVHIGPVSSGRHRQWHPFHPFVQTLVGVRQFLAESPSTSIETIELHVMSPSVWSPVLAGRIPVAEILSSEVAKIWVDIRDPDGASEILAIIARGPTSLEVIKKLCGLDPARWKADILPRPSEAPVQDTSNEQVVAPTSLVVLTPLS